MKRIKVSKYGEIALTFAGFVIRLLTLLALYLNPAFVPPRQLGATEVFV